MSEQNTVADRLTLAITEAGTLIVLASEAAAQQTDRISAYALPAYVNNLICTTVLVVPLVMALLVIAGGLLHVAGGEQSRAKGKKLVTGSIAGFLIFLGLIGLVTSFYPYINLDNCVASRKDNQNPIADARVSYVNDPVTYKFAYVTIGNKAYFDASRSYDPDGTVSKYKWDLGDGTNLIAPKAEHTYRDEGIYYAVLTVEDDQGAVSAPSTVIVIVNPPVEAEIIRPSGESAKQQK
jgi:hypothetical protein